MDVAGWLRGLGLDRYEGKFRDNNIGLDVLPHLTADDIRDIGVVAVGDRRRLLAAIAALAGATQTVDIDFTSMDSNLGPQFAILLRYQDANNYYLIQRVTGGSSRLYISKVVNGVTTALANVGITNPQKAVSFHMTGRVTGSTLSLDFNGINKLNINDTTFANGHVGFQIYNKNSAVQQEADNFTATVCPPSGC